MTTRLSNRPFLIITTYVRPLQGVSTSVKGWSKPTGSTVLYENVQTATRITNKMLREATVIVDILAAKVVKSRFGDVSDETVATEYLGKYREYCTNAVDYWMKKYSEQFMQTKEYSDLLEARKAELAAKEVDDATND